IVPPIYDPTVADRNEPASTEEAHALVRRLARHEGLLVGPSAGAALAVSLRVAEEVDRAVIVMIFPDRGDRYLSEPFWNGGDEVTPQVWTGSNTAIEESEGALVLSDEVLASIRQHGTEA